MTEAAKSWRDLLAKPQEIVFPWLGGRELRQETRTWQIVGQLPVEHGWYRFSVATNRTAKLVDRVRADPATSLLGYSSEGYLVGNRFLPDDLPRVLNPGELWQVASVVYLVEDGLPRFSRIIVGRMYDGGPLVFREPAFLLGPESEVMEAFLNRGDLAKVKGLSPALDSAFLLEVYQREETEKRRKEVERLRALEEAKRKEEEAHLARAAKAKELFDLAGDGAGRRALAAVDFETAAKKALEVSGAFFLDSRRAHGRNEMVVIFRYEQRRFECTCDRYTLRIIDSGICLTDHDGTKGDTRFSLESLPSVIKEAILGDKLVVYRHVD
jgi:hypothetical protein